MLGSLFPETQTAPERTSSNVAILKLIFNLLIQVDYPNLPWSILQGGIYLNNAAADCTKYLCDLLQLREEKMKIQLPYVRFFFLFLLLSLWLLGCSDGALTFTIQFADISGLKQNDYVYLGKNEIGQVNRVTYTSQGDYLVEVKIKPEFKNAATINTQFFIEQSPLNTAAMAVIVEQPRPGGALLQADVTVQGLSRTGYLNKIFKDLQEKAEQAEIELNKALGDLKKSLHASSETLSKSLDAALNDLSIRLDTFKGQLGKVPDSQEIQQLEESIKKFGEEFQNAQKRVQDHIRTEMFPRFRMELDHLREQLKKQGRDKEMDKIDEQAKNLQMV
jgi:hypothetical protein